MDTPTLPVDPLVERANTRHLIADIGWFGLAMPAVANFLSVYALRLGANPLALGLLSALPAIFMLLATLLTSWWRSRYSDSLRAVFWPTALMRVRLLGYAMLPVLPVDWQVPALITIASLSAVPQGLSSVLFLVMMREAVSDQVLTRLISHRMMAFNVGVAISTILLGLWLERTVFPGNYQVMFVAGFGAMAISMWHVTRVRVLYPTPPPTPESPLSMRPWRDPTFRRMALGIMGQFGAFYAIVPLIPLKLVDDLGATEGFVALYSLLELISAAAGSLLADRLIMRYSHRHVIRAGLGLTALAALLLALAPSLPLTLPAALIGGGAWAACDIAQFSFFSLHTPADKRSRHTNAYFQGISVALFVGPLLGSGLANAGVAMGIVLTAGAGLRLLAGWGIHQALRLPEVAPIPAAAPAGMAK